MENIGFRGSLPAIAAVVACILTASAFAGGFWITLEKPDKSAAKNVLAMVRVNGCFSPSVAKIVAKAEGIVNGQRQSMSIDLIPTAEAGLYSIKSPQTKAGVWVLTVTAHIPVLGPPGSSIVAKLNPDGTLVMPEKSSGIIHGSPGKLDLQAVERALQQTNSENLASNAKVATKR